MKIDNEMDIKIAELKEWIKEQPHIPQNIGKFNFIGNSWRLFEENFKKYIYFKKPKGYKMKMLSYR